MLEPIEEKDLDLEGKFSAGGLEKKPEKEGVPFAPEREAPHEVSASESDAAYQDVLAKVTAVATDDQSEDAVADDAKKASLQIDAQSQVQHLVDLAESKGVVHAVKVAKHLDDNYVLDMFHDKLLEEQLHKALMEKGILKED